MKIILIDERISLPQERSLERLGLTPMRLPRDRSLGDGVASHPDTLIFHHGGQLITTADYCEDAAYIFSDIRELCPDVRISFSSDVRGKSYPKDCCLNALVIGDKIFCNTRYISESVKAYAEKMGLTLLHTNQGYPACTVLTFGDRAITSDRGMADLLSRHGIRVLIIKNGHISLPPHEYGFIGGCSFVYNNKVCFFGDIETHPEAKKIRSFIENAGYEIICLSDGGLIDLGGGIIL